MKKINLYGSLDEKLPLIILNVFEGDGSEAYKECESLGISAFNLAAVSGLDWDAELSPWEIKPVFKGDNFRGGADLYLTELENEIIPHISEKLSPKYIAIAGYSLAGLFATYAAFKTDIFSGIVSASGSFWYPEFTDFAVKNNISTAVRYAYFSLGDKESNTKNELMKAVKERTLEVEKVFAGSGVISKFEENPGNHFKDTDKRMAKGIKWLIDNMN